MVEVSQWKRAAWIPLGSRVGFGAAGALLSVAISTGAFLLHFNLSTAGSLQLLAVVLVALRYGFVQATVVSLTGVACLNYLFMPPLFQFTVADPQNWVSLATFEATALLVSGLSSKARLNAEEAERQRRRSMKLYELSRAVLLIDGRTSLTEQLSALIREFIGVETVELWTISDVAPRPGQDEVSLAHIADADCDDPALRLTKRTLRLGTTPVGAMTLRGWECDPLLADAVASLAAIAVERARAIQRENRAEAERNTEQLRTAVLDGLAHGFKTPLTAIQTASSGLLAIDQLSETQTELVTIIDEQATLLAQLTTRLLRTAALENREVRLRRAEASLAALVENVVNDQDAGMRARIAVRAAAGLRPCEVDGAMIELALLQLVDNAAKYSAVESRIEVAITQTEFETMVAVENEGSWIRPEERLRIFERFYRGTDAAHGPTGSGLGLSIVKKTAEAHGGRAWVECEPNRTRFLLTVQNYRRTKHG